MSTGIAERPDTSEVGNGGGPVVVRPQSVGIAAEQQRAIAEIQAALTVAAARPRDEVAAVDKIRTACQRIRLAESAEYVYDRGGTEITGPTIDLLTVIAICWGNTKFGFRELLQGNGESTVEAFAWDLETNSQPTRVFVVPHKRVTKRVATTLTDPRDIYELIANQAQRRVRACLEAIIPPDVVEDAVAQCRATLKETAQVTPDSIAKLMEAFGKLGVNKEQLEKRLGRRLDAMQPAQLVNLRRIYKSIMDGMSKPADWFEQPQGEQPQQTAADAAKDALRKKATLTAETTPPDAGDAPNQDLIDLARMDIAAATDDPGVDYAADELLKRATDDVTRNAINGLRRERKVAINQPKKSGKQKELVN